MGKPTPQPPVTGEDCPFCDGTLWPPGQTPRFVLLLFWDLEKCAGAPEDPPNGLWLLEQTAGTPNEWSYEDDKFLITIELQATRTEVGISGPPPGYAWNYFYDWPLGCASVFVNDYLACFPNIASKHGEAESFWPL